MPIRLHIGEVETPMCNLAAAAMERRAGGTLKEAIRMLDLGPVNGLEAALARLGRAVLTAGN